MVEIIQESDDLRVSRVIGAGTQKLSILKNIYVEKGSLEDWKLLHELHYKNANLGIGPRYWRCVLDDGKHSEVIGVMVFTVPKPLDSGRNEVFTHLKPNQNGVDNRMVNQMRMNWINKNIILSSRTVLDTMYRNAGIAYRFKNLVYRMQGQRYVESRSSMSRFNPFSLKAGMKFVAPKSASALERGLKFFARYFKSAPYDSTAILQELRDMPEAIREMTLKEMRSFYYKHSSMEKSGDKRLLGTSRIDSMDTPTLLRQMSQLIFGATIYAIWENPDMEKDETGKVIGPRPLPKRLPLLAFDNQAPDEPLRLDLLPETTQ